MITHVERYTPRVHMPRFNVMLSISNTPNSRDLCEICLMLLLHASNDSIKTSKPCTPLGPPPYMNIVATHISPKLTPSLHESIQVTPFYIGLNTLLVNTKHSSSNARHSPSKQPPCWVCVIFFACVCVGASDMTTASDDPS
jgi:hypothetical protein